MSLFSSQPASRMSATRTAIAGTVPVSQAVVGLGDLGVAYPDTRRVTNDMRLVGDRGRRDDQPHKARHSSQH
jgi:hypothetical protein